ncbi:hypothetical protein S83_066832, partial [Arachis hypogaea]
IDYWNSHAFGDQYRATDTVINGAGKLKLVFGIFTRVAIKQLDRITGQGQFVISVEDTLKIIICRKQHKKLYSLEMELAAIRNEGFVLKQLLETNGIYSEGKLLVMIGVLTTFGCQKNRDAIHNAWMGSEFFLFRCSFEETGGWKGIVAGFVIGRRFKFLLLIFLGRGGMLDPIVILMAYKQFCSKNHGNNQDKDIDRENRLTNDFLIL